MATSHLSLSYFPSVHTRAGSLGPNILTSLKIVNSIELSSDDRHFVANLSRAGTTFGLRSQQPCAERSSSPTNPPFCSLQAVLTV